LEPPEIDVKVGMGVYSTTGSPCPAKVRVVEEDFRVSELLEPQDLRRENGPGLLPLYRVEKVGIDTFHVARIIAKEVGSRVSFAGMKDKRAVATQYLSPTSTRCKKPSMIEGANFRAELAGYLPSPLTRRMVLGNSFAIVMRDACSGVEEKIEDAYRVCRARRLPNFFGLQRFGNRDPVTHLIGRELVAHKFEGAVMHLVATPRRNDEKRVMEAREMAWDGKYSSALEAFTEKQDLEKTLLRRLVRKRDDFLGALRALPIAVRRFFVHAYQSYVFNRTMTKALLGSLDISAAVRGDNWSRLRQDGLTLEEVHGAKEDPKTGALPLVQLVGYAYRDYGSRFDRLVMEVLEEENLRPEHFYLKDAQEMSAEGGFRRASLTATGMGYACSERNASLSFALARGGYATTLLREIIKPTDPLSTGF